jgi:hypothetical protein
VQQQFIGLIRVALSGAMADESPAAGLQPKSNLLVALKYRPPGPLINRIQDPDTHSRE